MMSMEIGEEGGTSLGVREMIMITEDQCQITITIEEVMTEVDIEAMAENEEVVGEIGKIIEKEIITDPEIEKWEEVPVLHRKE